MYDYKYIKSLKPCDTGLTNFKNHYPKFNGSLSELMELDKIPYNDKVWMISKCAPINIIKMWSVLCAETQLHVFEKAFPNDNRIRDCIEVIKKVKDFSNLTDNEKSKLRAAESAAWSAASAAESAARSAASAARSAAESAAWSAAESAAWSAASAARSAAEKKQEEKNIEIMVTLLKEKGL